MRWIILPADKTKTNDPRQVLIGTRLAAELKIGRLDPAGHDFPPPAFAFGDGMGRARKSIRTAWDRACPAASISDLHCHDLRREFASRLLESGTETHTVQAFLGHANISTTSPYLAPSAVQMEKAIARLDGESSQNVANPARTSAASGTESQAAAPSNVLH